uniref:Selenoprotein S n=1 Tax=Ciona savignyi TaxID=51511 RepID=H2ZEH0_CIOSA
MDEDVLEANNDGNTQAEGQQAPLLNQNPYLFVAIFNEGLTFLQTYGWFLLLGFVAAMFVWSNIEKSVKKFLFGRKKVYDVTDTMTAEQVEARNMAMEQARKKLQEKHDEAVRIREEKRLEQEEQKRLQKISDHEALKAGKSQSLTTKRMEKKPDPNIAPTCHIKRNKDAKPLRPSGQNPLAGSSNSARWRPGTSRPAAGG